MHRGRGRWVLAAGAVLVALALAQGDEPFSRSRWIAERMATRRFSTGVQPSLLPRPEPVIGGFQASPGLPSAKYPNIRVSHDIVPGATGAAQPETQTEPFVAINPAYPNNLLAGYQDERFEDGGARALTYAYSVDGARHWSEKMIPKLTAASGGPWDRASDPWVGFGPDSRAYFVSLVFNETTADNGVAISTSYDGGKTFGSPVQVHLNTTESDFDDKESMVADNYSASPYRGNVYVAWDNAWTRQMFVSRLVGGVGQFGSPIQLDPGNNSNIGIVMVVAPNGTVYAIWVKGASVVFSKSTNGGANWSAPAKIAGIQAAGVSGCRVGDGIIAAAIDRSSGAVYVAWQDDRFTSGVDQIVVSRSTNGGQQWSAPIRVSDDPDDSPCFTPTIAVNGEGKVGVAYYTMRNDPAHQYLVDVYLTVSSNKGKTFIPSRRITTKTFDIRNAAFAGGYFLGDYEGMAAGPKLFFPFFVATLKPSAIDPTHTQPDAFVSRVAP